MDDDSKKFRGLLTPALELLEREPVVVEVIVRTEGDAIDEALINWSWPERRTTQH
jgi:hypothetical protein